MKNKKNTSNWKDKFPKQFRFFETDRGILYCGDCLEIMNRFSKDSIDLIVTSPPYNVGIDYEVWNDALPLQDYLNFVKSFLKLFKKILKDDGRFAINILYDVKMKHLREQSRVSLLCEYYHLLKVVGLKYNTIVDLEEDSPERVKYTAWGSWLSPSSPYIYNPKECILIGYKKRWTKEKNGTSTIDKKLFKEIVKGIWKYRPETRQMTKSNFSEDVPYKAIQGLSYENDIVLDPFMGSGTTAVVCEKTNRRWIGIEINPNYCKIAKNRIEEFIGRLF